MRSTITTLAVLVLAAAAAPAGTLISETRWGGPSSEVTEGAAVASDGSTYLTGFSTSFGQISPGDAVIFAIKFAADGSLAWQRVWEGPQMFGGDESRDVAVAPDGSVYVTGQIPGTNGDAVLLKFSSDGSLLWQRKWDGGVFEAGEAVAVASDGSVYVTGGTNSFGTVGAYVVKFAPDGTVVWQKGWTGGGAGTGIAVAPDGSIYVAGLVSGPGPFIDVDVLLLKLDAAGNLIWQRTYSAEEIADARGGVTVGPDGSVYVAGALQGPGPGSIADIVALLLKFAADGTLQWDRSWGGKSGDDAAGVAVAADGSVFLAGSSNSFGQGIDDAFVTRHLPESGRAIEANTWGGTGLDKGAGIGIAPDGTISLGATAENPPYVFDTAARKTSRVRGTVSTPTGSLVDLTGTSTDAGGTVSTPDGSTLGDFDAALVRIAP